MPWNEVDLMSLRREFIHFATQANANLSELCRRFGLSRKTAYKWLQRFRERGDEGLRDQSRQPRACPHQTPPALEEAVRQARRDHPAWGGRKLRQTLLNQGRAGVPAASTITAILRRAQLLDPAESPQHQPVRRFQRATPNELWQMDFKGDFPTLTQRCYPLSLLDDCTRFAPGLFACPDQQRDTVQACLQTVFRTYGLPHALLMDNGTPWGGAECAEHTQLSVWLMRLGIHVLHGRPYHPQTQGKIERFHRTLSAELLQRESFRDLAHGQQRFDAWRESYNFQRPHEALDLRTPGQLYRPSPLPFPESLPPILYPPGCETRRVQTTGRFDFRGHSYRLGRAFTGLPIALQPAGRDGWFDVFFAQHRVAVLDLHLGTLHRSGFHSPAVAS